MQEKKDWPKQKDTINKEHNSLTQQKAFGPIVRTVIDYEETHSHVVDAITICYLISLATHTKLDMRLMDVLIAYLYGSLQNYIYVKKP